MLFKWRADSAASGHVRRPGPGEERLAATQHDGAEVEPILVDEPKVGQTSRQLWSGNLDLPVEPGFQPTYKGLEVILDKCGVGADRLQRARHYPLRLASPHRREVALLRAPLRTVFVPITHQLVHAATVHTAGQVAHPLAEVMEERWTRRRQFQVARHAIDVASRDCDIPKTSFAMLQNLHLRFLTNILNRRYVSKIQGRRHSLPSCGGC